MFPGKIKHLPPNNTAFGLEKDFFPEGTVHPDDIRKNRFARSVAVYIGVIKKIGPRLQGGFNKPFGFFLFDGIDPHTTHRNGGNR
jgi:hypothetical protein